jgi:hypothetical protein
MQMTGYEFEPMVFNLIQARFIDTTKIFSSKKIDYRNLRRALVPSIDRNERAPVFIRCCDAH